MEVKEIVKEKYGEAARRVTSGGSNSCCGASSALDSCCDPITSNLYDEAQAGQIPEAALKASLGCGKLLPAAIAGLRGIEFVRGSQIKGQITFKNRGQNSMKITPPSPV